VLGSTHTAFHKTLILAKGDIGLWLTRLAESMTVQKKENDESERASVAQISAYQTAK